MLKYYKIGFFVFMFLVFISLSGCGIFSLLATPTEAEMRIPAEYNLLENLNGKLLIIVVKQGGSQDSENIGYHLSGALEATFRKKFEVEHESFISYEELAGFKDSRPDFLKLSPVTIGKELGADKVLAVAISDYQLYEIAGTGNYEGSLRTLSRLYDVPTGERVWPQYSEGKVVQVAFDCDSGRGNAAVIRLVSSTSHCIVRYLYDCPKDSFEFSDEKTGSMFGW